MENHLEITNQAELSGLVLSQPEFSHKYYGESFYIFLLGIERRSGYQDQIRILISDHLICDEFPTPGQRVCVQGQIRTYNEFAEGRNKLNILVFAKEFFPAETEEEDENHILLEGYLCKPPMVRVSPLGREICDLMLAVNRMYNKSDYIPCIAWGRNARYAGTLDVGTKVLIQGRIQSREYRKRDEEGEITIKTAYEVSLLKIDVCV